MNREMAAARQAMAVLARMAAALGAVFAGSAFIRYADTWTDITGRVNIAAGSMANGAAVMKRLDDMARRTYSSLGQTADSYLLNATAMRELGYSTNETLNFVEAINNALVISGAKGDRAASVMNALSKAMAMGKLSGDELNTVISTGGRVAEALAAGMGVTTNQLRTLGTQGKITGDVLAKSLIGQLDTLREEADGMSATVGDGMLLIGNSILSVVGRFDEATGASAALASALVKIADGIKVFGDYAIKAAALASTALSPLGSIIDTIGAAFEAVADNIDTFAVAATTAGAAMLASFGPAILGSIASAFVAVGIAGVNAIRAITAAMMANPLGLIVVGITAAVTAIYHFRDEIEQAIGIDAWGIIKDTVNLIINSFRAAYEDVKFVFGNLSAFVEGVFVAAANVAIDAVNKLIQKMVDGMNWFHSKINEVLGTSIPMFDKVGDVIEKMAPSKKVVEKWKEHGENIKKIMSEDTLGNMGEAIASSFRTAEEATADLDAKIKGTGASIGEVDKKAAKLAKAYENIVEGARDFIAQQELERSVLGMSEEAANRLRYEMDLLNQARSAGIDLSPKQSAELKDLAAQMSAAEAETKRLKEAFDAQKKAGEEFAKTLSSALSDLFTEPMKDADAFFDTLTRGFAQLGANNLQTGLDRLFSGQGFGPAANDNDRWAGLREVGKAVEKGAFAGTEAGAQNGIGALFGGKLSEGAMKNLSAGLGGFGMGYQAQDPAMGGIGGALSGFMAGGPIGAVVGGIGGLLGGLFGGSSRRDKERKEARQSLWDNAASVRSTLDRGLGVGAGNYRSEFAAYEAEAMKIRRTAMKAGNWAMEREAREAISRFRATLKSDFRSAFDGTVEAMRSGLGSNSPFVQAQQSVIGLRDELKNFIADAKWAGESTRVATRAARDYALSQLAGSKELSPMETEMQRIRGTAAGLRNTLKELGMSSSQADKAIRDGLVKAVAGLRDQYRTDVRGSINELSGKGYLNEMADAQKLYNERLKDAKALGLSASLANREFSLSIASIAMQSGLTGKQLRRYADQLDIPSKLLKGILKDLSVQNAEKWSSTVSDLRLRRAQATTDTSGLKGQLQLFDMQAKLERQRLKEAGATGAALVALDRATGAERIRLIKEFNKQQVALQQDFGVRYLQATVDASGLKGQLQLFDAQAKMERQRLKESGATTQTLIALERALGAERQALIDDFNRQKIDEAKSALDEALDAWRNFAKGVREFRDGLRLDSNLSVLSPQDRLTEARRQYEETLRLAMVGDRDAMNRLTSISQSYLEEAKSYFASTEDYAAIFNSVNTALAQAETSATSQVSAAEKQITLLSKQVSTLASVDKTLLTVSQLTKELTTSVTKYLAAGGKPFSSGGYTGDLGVHQIAGVVHGREFVANASTTARYRPQLEAMQAGTYRPQQIVTNDNRAGFRELATVFAAGQSKMIEALKEELAEVRGELRRLTNETRISGDKKSRITAAGR